MERGCGRRQNLFGGFVVCVAGKRGDQRGEEDGLERGEVGGWACWCVEWVGELAGADQGFGDGLGLMVAEDAGVAAGAGEYGVEAEGEGDEKNEKRREPWTMGGTGSFLRRLLPGILLLHCSFALIREMILKPTHATSFMPRVDFGVLSREPRRNGRRSHLLTWRYRCFFRPGEP